MDKSILVHNDHLLLFVAGLPSKATPAEVIHHFSTCGSVRLLRLRNEKTGSRIVQANPQNNIRRGFCIIEAADQNSYDYILKSGNTPFQGKTLNISRFVLEKSQLNRDGEYLKRQVMLQGVPGNFTSSEIVGIFEKFLGRIKRLYLVLSPSLLGDETDAIHNLTKVYLVEFYSPRSAEKAKLISSLYLSWLKAPVQIQGFEKAPDSISCKQVYINQDSIPAYSNTIECNNEASENVDLETYNTAEISKQLIPNMKHTDQCFLKPTDRRYHTTRELSEEESHASRSKGFSPRLIDMECLRFNLSTKRQPTPNQSTNFR